MGRNFCFKNISGSTRFGKKTISIFIFLQIEVYRLTSISEDISDLMVFGGLSMWVIIFAQFAISKEVACVGQIEFCWLMEAHLWKKHLKWDGTWKALCLVWTLVIFKSHLASTAGVTCVFTLFSDTAKGILWILEDSFFFQAIYKSHLFYGLDVA